MYCTTYLTLVQKAFLHWEKNLQKISTRSFSSCCLPDICDTQKIKENNMINSASHCEVITVIWAKAIRRCCKVLGSIANSAATSLKNRKHISPIFNCLEFHYVYGYILAFRVTIIGCNSTILFLVLEKVCAINKTQRVYWYWKKYIRISFDWIS